MKNNMITCIKEGFEVLYAVLMIALLIITFPLYKKKLISYIEKRLNNPNTE